MELEREHPLRAKESVFVPGEAIALEMGILVQVTY